MHGSLNLALIICVIGGLSIMEFWYLRDFSVAQKICPLGDAIILNSTNVGLIPRGLVSERP
ncbi:hypothetical protein MtrunA17_Chr4g0018261 [Medicago truncatula]|uniref:Transmembrane protein n=1 Tax=Medicago truncatula TaxID=3880 RepID=A0A396I2G8_MEDTR|nr:hypothetical protein MtrunA17_Chr4g0018261 [Medicago truncatula]